MKTSAYKITIIAAFALLLSLNLNATNFDFADENYVDDIPFSTEEIFNSLNNQPALEVNFDFPEEDYIDDIPFETKCVSESCLFEQAINTNFEMEEENYINDTTLPLE